MPLDIIISKMETVLAVIVGNRYCYKEFVWYLPQCQHTCSDSKMNPNNKMIPIFVY
jgi:hypothetical protein